MIFIGIDPGLSGAVAFIRQIETLGISGTDSPIMHSLASVHDTLTCEIGGAKGKVKREYLISNMVDVLMREGKDCCQSFAVVESVHSMPEQGVASSFNFGRGLGIWEGILAGLQIPYEKVSPQRWKKQFLADMGKDKDAARLVAQRLFPSLSPQLARKKDDGRAEALLMAMYAKKLRTT